MDIKYKNYKLIQQAVGFDLIQLVESRKIGDGTPQKPTGELYMKENLIGYNMQLESCINKIITLELLEYKELVELKDYIVKYREIAEEIKKAIT